jgi:hypothetical protein
MKKSLFQWIEEIATYILWAGLLGASLLNLTLFQRQLLMLLLLISTSVFYVYKSQSSQ